MKSDDEKFIFDGRTQMDYDGDLTFTLILKNVRKSDRGEFSCVANNQLVNSRNHTKKAVLKVNCKYFYSSGKKVKIFQRCPKNTIEDEGWSIS